jgi:catechol 2,3-dioxygenase-like lactoylglutathione lyase family enzyme
MPVTELDHYFVRVSDLDRSKRFYCDVLGFEVLPRPDLPFPGYWLGVGGRVQVHMGPHGIENSALYYLGSRADSATDNSGVVDHIAFLAADPQSVEDRLQAMGVTARKRYLPASCLFQMFVQDPDGITIELNFFGIKSEPAWLVGAENYADMPRVVAGSN